MKILNFSFMLLLIFSALMPASIAQKKTVFPGEEWAVRKPESMGLNKEALAKIGKLMEKSQSNGVLIKNGYLVAEWNFDGPADKKIEVQSITKSITSMVLGLALKEGKIASINDLVKKYYPGFNAGPYTDQITFWHLVTASSGIAAKRYGENYVDPGNMAPGLESRYTNDHLAELAKALTYIYGEPISNIASSRVLKKIGADVDWKEEKEVSVRMANGKEIPVNAGFAFSHWTAADLARVGWLYLNKGNWKGEQLIPENYVEQCRTNINIPVMPFSRRSGPVISDNTKRAYGLAWRGHYTKSGQLIWYMSGNGGQMCVVLPEEGMVFVKINGIGKPYQPFNGIDKFEGLLLAMNGEKTTRIE